MKKLLVSIDPEMYKKYKGLQDYLDSIAMEVALFNSGNDDCDSFMDRLIRISAKSTVNVSIVPHNDFTYSVIQKTHEIKLGTITRINLL